MRISHSARIARIVLVTTLGLFGVAACQPHEAAICQATPGCVDAYIAHSVEQDQLLYRWAQGVLAGQRQQPSQHPFLVCVRAHESDTDGGYLALNDSSGASGAYQFLDSTWRNVSGRAGHGGYSKAMHAPVAVQDAVALWTLNNIGRSPWNGTGC